MLGTIKIRSNLHMGQYVGSLPSDSSQGQAVVEPLSLPGVTKYCISTSFFVSRSKKGCWA